MQGLCGWSHIVAMSFRAATPGNVLPAVCVCVCVCVRVCVCGCSKSTIKHWIAHGCPYPLTFHQLEASSTPSADMTDFIRHTTLLHQRCCVSSPYSMKFTSPHTHAHTHTHTHTHTHYVPMMEVAPFSVAMTTASSIAFEPPANFSNSNTPIGLYMGGEREREREGGREGEGEGERVSETTVLCSLTHSRL